jgi:hypothetical protein
MELYWAVYEGERLLVSTAMYPLLVLPPRKKAKESFAARVRAWLDAWKRSGVMISSDRVEMAGLFAEMNLLTDQYQHALAVIGAQTHEICLSCPMKIMLLPKGRDFSLAVWDTGATTVRWQTPLADVWDEALFLHEFPALLNSLGESPKMEIK